MDAKQKADEAREDREPVLIGIEDGLFLGNLPAATSAALLGRHGITQTLNLSVNVDVPPLTLADGTVVRRAKVGLIDGPGNVAAHLAAAVLSIAGMTAQVAPGKPTYPDHRPGSLLVHCRGARSRSVVTLALFLAWARPETYPGPEAAIEALRRLRGLGPGQPHPAMLDLVLATFRLLPPPAAAGL